MRFGDKPLNVVLTATIVTPILLICAAQNIQGRNQSDGQIQSQATAPPTFDVASIREWGPNEKPNGPVVAGPVFLPGRVSSNCASLQSLVFFAYHLTRSVPIEGLPAWGTAPCGIGYQNTFAIQATMPGNTTEDQARDMMKALLADRFKLAAHWETKQMPIYGLVVARSGFKLKPFGPNDHFPLDAYRCPQEDRHCHVTGFEGTMVDLAGSLAMPAGRPVLDETGITGNYGGTVKWAGDDAQDSPLPSSLVAALRETYGLELKSETGPAKVLVVDHVEKPTPN